MDFLHALYNDQVLLGPRRWLALTKSRNSQWDIRENHTFLGLASISCAPQTVFNINFDGRDPLHRMPATESQYIL